MTSNEDRLKEQLLGQVKKAHRTGGHQPDSAKIDRLIEAGNAIAIFCSGCGMALGLSKEGLERLWAEAKIRPKDNPTHYLLVCAGCPTCSENFQDMKLMKRK